LGKSEFQTKTINLAEAESMEDFIIDPEVSSLLVPLTKEELDGLEKQILDGLHVDPGVVGVVEGESILADGHNRLNICRAHGIDFPTRKKEFASWEDLIQWVIDNQLGRRNLTEERKSYYRGKEYLNTKKHPVFHDVATVATSTEAEGRTREKVAVKHGVSARTVQNDADFAEAVDKLGPKEREAVLAGTSGETKKSITGGAKPVLCKDCQRVGSKDCPKCAEARNGKPAAKKQTNGSVIFDDRKVADMIGKLVRSFDARAAVYGKGPKHQKCIDTLDKVLIAFTQWQVETNS
jgi:hypothetical protein